MKINISCVHWQVQLTDLSHGLLGIVTVLFYVFPPSLHLPYIKCKNFSWAAFVSTSTYLELFRASGSDFTLLPVGAVTKHPVKGELLGYYSDIVVHRDVK